MTEDGINLLQNYINMVCFAIFYILHLLGTYTIYNKFLACMKTRCPIEGVFVHGL